MIISSNKNLMQIREALQAELWASLNLVERVCVRASERCWELFRQKKARVKSSRAIFAARKGATARANAALRAMTSKPRQPARTIFSARAALKATTFLQSPHFVATGRV